MQNLYDFGYGRVIEPKGFIPIAAWNLDNNFKLKKNEVRIRVKRIKFEEGNFRELCNVCYYDEEKIKSRVLDIVNKRGKLHNPFTDSGGICYGIVDEIGEEYRNTYNIKVNDPIICLTSLTSIPLNLNKIGKINFNYGQVDVEGYAILFETSPIVHIQKGINLPCLLYAFDESGSVEKTYELAKKGKKFLILGTGILSILIYSAAIKKSAGSDSRIVAVLEKESIASLKESDIENILKGYVDKFYVVDIVASLKTYEFIKESEFKNSNELFDVSINCANLLGIETISVLLTKEHGILFFTNLINNYNTVLLFAESLGKSVNIISLEEYTKGFTKFTIDLLNSLEDKLCKINKIYNEYSLIGKMPKNMGSLIQHTNIEKMEDYIYSSEVTRRMIEEIVNIANYDCNVIIQGETGVGKEKILELLHKNSKRKVNMCVKINCAAIQESLAESELFGYESGAFTGATNGGKVGYFELANNGILFLDEVGELSLSIQTKLLRVLQESQFYKVGGRVPIQVNVRVICASNLNLRELVKAGKFREDLYYRLNICEINIPPLRDRIDDVFCLAQHFLDKYNDKYMQSKTLSSETIFEMKRYSWPGNVRELENTIHRSVVNCKKTIISIDDISIGTNKELYKDNTYENIEIESMKVESEMNLSIIMDNHEKAIIEEALKREGSTRKAAKSLGISQSQLMRKKSKYDL